MRYPHTSFLKDITREYMARFRLILLLLLVTACDEIGDTVCTEIGCLSNYEVVFNAEDDSLSLGEYEVQIDLQDEQQFTCTFTLSQTGDACQSMDCIENRTCNQFGRADGVFYDAVYYLYPENQVIVTYPPLEGELTISINQNGQPLSGLVTEPVYQTNQPNGPGCDPICFNARNEVTVFRE